MKISQVILIGGETHFKQVGELARLLNFILKGNEDPNRQKEYFTKIEKLLSEGIQGSCAYEEELFGILGEKGIYDKVKETIQREKTFEQESEEYKKFVEHYHRIVKEIQTQL